MKQAEKDKPVHTTPKGVWEGSTTLKKEHKTTDTVFTTVRFDYLHIAHMIYLQNIY